MTPITFKAMIYRDLKFASDGGGRLTLEFPASEEMEVVKLLLLRGQVLTVVVAPSEEG